MLTINSEFKSVSCICKEMPSNEAAECVSVINDIAFTDFNAYIFFIKAIILRNRLRFSFTLKVHLLRNNFKQFSEKQSILSLRVCASTRV